MEDDDIQEFVDMQVERDGVSTIGVSDGQLFVFSLYILEKLLVNAQQSPDRTATIFVKRQVSS